MPASPKRCAFNINGKYVVAPGLLTVIRAVPGTSQRQRVYCYREVAHLLSRYVIMNKRKLFPSGYFRAAFVAGDPLGDALGVDILRRRKVTRLLRSQLSPWTLWSEIAPFEAIARSNSMNSSCRECEGSRRSKIVSTGGKLASSCPAQF